MSPSDPLDPAALRDLIAPELRRWKVPGVEVAVVRDGRVLVADGFGTTDAGGSVPVTATTLFHHGSTAKALTAVLAAVLVDEGALEWDLPVRDVVGDQRFHDEVMTQRVTLRDLLAHRSGLARHDLAWIANPSWSRADLAGRIRHLEPAADLRAEFAYSNLGYVVAARAIETATGSTWEDELRRRVLEPLGMTHSFTSLNDTSQPGEVARGHDVRGDVAVEVAYRALDAVAPAGQLLSCAEDSARWLLFQTGDGAPLLPPEAFAETRSLHIPVRAPPLLPDRPGWAMTWQGYGLGWIVASYRGRQAIWPSGGVDGFFTQVLVLPDDGVGVLISANADRTSLAEALMFELADRALGEEPREWFEAFREQDAKEHEEELQGAARATSIEGTTPSRPLDDYAGVYEHPGYGELRVALARDGLEFELGELALSADHRHFDTWTARYEPLDTSFAVTFITDAESAVAEAVADLEPSVTPVRFVRRPDATEA